MYLNLLVKHAKDSYLKVFYSVFSLFPIREKRIVFSSFYGKQFSGDPKAIYLLIEEMNLGTECIWVLNNRENRNFKTVNRYSLKHLYYLATCQYRIDNCQEKSILRSRSGCVNVQTWHGTPVKKIAQDIEQVGFSSIKKEWQKDALSWNYFITSSKSTTDLLSNAFNISRDICLEYGNPRNDILHAYSEDHVNNIKKKIGLNKDKKVILYAPTFRDGNDTFNIELDFNLLSKMLNDDYVFLVRMHSNIRQFKSVDVDGSFVVNVTDYDDVQDLLLISDCLVTDYSSLFFDFALLKRKMIFYAYDIEKYEMDSRGLYYNYRCFVPGNVVLNQHELIDEILSENVNEDIIDDFNNKYNSRSGDATFSVLKEIGLIRDNYV
ncbi:CDP-glycerol glycerophosphotransferase family protein [Shewanella oncorhynchi]|uniref:CDP-glycerol glycerophosphotransferase family protein n=1 Tax=Shewanella oncorhynchi TaxID=2726434 RepID=UPI003D793626